VATICDEERCIATVMLDDTVIVKAEGSFSMPPEMVQVERLGGRDDPPPRVVLVQGTGAIERVVAEMRHGWSERVRFGESFSSLGKRMLTITAAGVDKGAALAVACADMGMATEEVVAFGDAEIDLEMFRVAGHSVAMGQASDHVKAAAGWVTAPNTEDGVAQAVERLLAGDS
jgi:hydroxymethylpyrimidine pyrophosphatase-like HAD family hydrolase